MARAKCDVAMPGVAGDGGVVGGRFRLLSAEPWLAMAGAGDTAPPGGRAPGQRHADAGRPTAATAVGARTTSCVY